MIRMAGIGNTSNHKALLPLSIHRQVRQSAKQTAQRTTQSRSPNSVTASKAAPTSCREDIFLLCHHQVRNAIYTQTIPSRHTGHRPIQKRHRKKKEEPRLSRPHRQAACAPQNPPAARKNPGDRVDDASPSSDPPPSWIHSPTFVCFVSSCLSLPSPCFSMRNTVIPLRLGSRFGREEPCPMESPCIDV